MTHHPTGRRVAALAATLLLLFAAACGDDDPDASGVGSGSGTARTLEGTITVLAAQSLKGAFEQIASSFEAANQGVTVSFDFDASSALVNRMLEGSDADAFASADEANMTELTEEDLIAGEPEVFARNGLVIITKPGNPEGVTGLADLADVGVISLCGEAVPCGNYATDALEGAGVSIPESSVTRGQNAAATLTAVAEGDAVAGVVYITDAVAAGDSVEAVGIPAEQNVVASYPIGVLSGSGNEPVAEAFVEGVLGRDGQAVLKEFGFLPPT